MMQLNLAAVAVAVVGAFVASMAYYTILGPQMASLSPAYTNADRPPAWKVVVELLRSAVVATVVAGLSLVAGVSDAAGGVQLAVALWVGFPVVLLVGSVIWERVPPRLAAIHSGDWLVKLLLVAVIVTIWR